MSASPRKTPSPKKTTPASPAVEAMAQELQHNPLLSLSPPGSPSHSMADYQELAVTAAEAAAVHHHLQQQQQHALQQQQLQQHQQIQQQLQAQLQMQQQGQLGGLSPAKIAARSEDAAVMAVAAAAAAAAAVANPPSTPGHSNGGEASQASQSSQTPQPTPLQHGMGTPRPPTGSEEWHRMRRENHKEVERRRRETINEGISELSMVVPGCEKNKGSILARAVQYIQQLREAEASNVEKWTLEKLLADQACAELSGQLDQAKQEMDALRHEIEIARLEKLGLRSENASLRKQIGNDSSEIVDDDISANQDIIHTAGESDQGKDETGPEPVKEELVHKKSKASA